MEKPDRPRLLYGVIAVSALFVIALVIYTSLIPKNLPIHPPMEKSAAPAHAEGVDAIAEAEDGEEKEVPETRETETVFDTEALEVIREIQQDIAEKHAPRTEETDPAPPAKEERFISHNERRLEAMVREEEAKLQALEDALEYLDRDALELEKKWERLVGACDTGWYDPKDREDLERGWYRVWDIEIAEHEDLECRALLMEIRDHADEIREGVSTALEQARRDALLPGDVRKLRARYHFTWYGLN